MTQLQTTVNVLPLVGNATKAFFTVILNDNSLNTVTITNSYILYGNANLIALDVFIPMDNNPLAIALTGTYNGVTYFEILYTKAIYGQSTPDNYTRLVQKIPLGIFNEITPKNVIGQILTAKSKSINDYYQEYFNVQSQVYSDTYSTQLEFQYNGTIGLLSNSVYVNQLFQILSSKNIVALNSYSLELFVSKYIYYRLGTISAVYINDGTNSSFGYWNLGVPGNTELGTTTILAPYNPALQNMVWTIFNSGTFTDEFQAEISQLIINMSRADVGNPVIFNPEADPVAAGFTSVGPTYPTDPRTYFNKCIKYIGDNAYPLNIIGYYK